MMILMLAAAMTVAMLIATVFSLHEESRHIRQKRKIRSAQGFGVYR